MLLFTPGLCARGYAFPRKPWERDAGRACREKNEAGNLATDCTDGRG